MIREAATGYKPMDKGESDYKDWKSITCEVKPFPDLIPAVGMVTSLERERKREGKSPVDFYIKDMIDWEGIESLNTQSWPKATDRKATLRGGALAVRNTVLGAYHWAGFITAAAVIYSGARKLADYLF